MTEKSWKIMVREAKKSNYGLSLLYEQLNTHFKILAMVIAPQIREDAIQSARIKIWKNLDKIDLKREKTIKSALLAMAANAMRDEVRFYLRQRGKMVTCDNEAIQICATKQIRPNEFHFSGILQEYYQYVCDTGSFKNAHTNLANKKKVSVAKMVTDFHREVGNFLELNNLTVNSNGKNIIVESLINGFHL